MNPLFAFMSMNVSHEASAGPQTRQASVKLAISTPGWQVKLPHYVQTDESRVLSRSSPSDLEEQDSSAIFTGKWLISSNILPILDLFQNPQLHFCGGGIDVNFISSYFQFHFRFRCNAENDSITEIFCPSCSEMNHGVHDCFFLTIYRTVPIFQSEIDCCRPSLLRESVEKKMSANLIGSGLRRASLFLSFEYVKEVFEVGGGSRVVIPSSIKVISRSYVESLGSFESILFEKDSKVQGIEELAFYISELTSIIIPSFVKILCEFCFASCDSLESVMFKNGSKLHRLEGSECRWSGVNPVT
jgi:hypothetical protein